tara:strand:- start:136 stop:648 length:513 start_codon:yes stop_codon:yes gene_type:complete
MAESYKDSLRIDNNNQGVDSTLRTVVSGDGDTTGLQLEDGTTGNVKALGQIISTGHVTAGYGIIAGVETVDAGNGSGNATALSLNTLTSFVNTDTSKSHVSLADGTAGQLKIIFHKVLANTVSLVVTPANFAAGSTLTSDAASRGVMLIFDGTNWQVLGEVTGTAEFVIA